MAKDKQKKHAAAEATAASGNMKRKEFDKKLATLQVELTRLQTWIKDKGHASSWSSRAGTRRARAA
jgi:polyphosphate kinase 2 (PPK2 family)